MRIYLNMPLILCHFFLFSGSQSADEEITEPTRLTGHGTKVTTIQIQDFDQCFPRDAAKTFGLEFRLPRIGGGRCEDGLIICYPSIMATRSLGHDHSVDIVSLNDERFNIDNIANNSVAEECQSEAKKLGNSIAKITWHGIGIKLNRQSNWLNVAILDTSFSAKSYIVPDVFRQFNIHLGNKNNFSSYITIDEEVIEVEDAKVEQYKNKSLSGAKLRDFVGFWVLGLDMIPWDAQRMRLFVIRHCNCSLEAWLLRPSDSDPTDPKEASMGTGRFEDRCDNRTQTLSMSLNNISEANQVISLRLLTDKMLNDQPPNNTIMLKILQTIKGKKDFEQLSAHFLITDESVEVYMKNQSKENETFNHDFEFPNQTFEFDLQIWIQQYSYKITLRSQSKRGYFPQQWWDGLKFNEHNKLLLTGHYVLLEDPHVFPRQDLGEPDTTVSYYSYAPWSENSNLKVRIKLLEGKATQFSFYLLHDIPEPTKNMGATVMQMDVTVTKENVATMKFTDFFEREEHPLENLSNNMTSTFNELLKNGKQRAFEFKIVLNGTSLGISINGAEMRSYEPQLPIWAINYIRLEGNVTTLDNPEYIYFKTLKHTWKLHGKYSKIRPYEVFLVNPKEIVTPKFDNETQKMVDKTETVAGNFTIKLKTLLNYGDEILLTALRDKVKSDGINNFAIILMHESMDDNVKIGDIVMKIEYDFVVEINNDSTKYYRKEARFSHRLHKEDPMIARTTNHELSELGGKFDLQIIAETNRFLIKINHENHVTEIPYPNATVNGQNVTIPPWAVDHIRICGNYQLLKTTYFDIRKYPEENPERITAIKQINFRSGRGFLMKDEKITVAVEKQKANLGKVDVLFLNEALSFNEIIGKTIMKAELYNNKLSLSYSIDGKKNETPQNCAEVKMDENDKYEFQFIVLNDTAFNVTVDDWEQYCTYSTPFPIWTIQYITVEYDKSVFHPPIINCTSTEKYERCIEPKHNKIIT
ncbi:hypothetical protein niasHT_012075 [Heterodera trifolii]|uniref:Galectin domain-containing protein n=1 Tax=Heterodera trifolii TaxID=157864 RepID=A0ABD2LAN0_9BILA